MPSITGYIIRNIKKTKVDLHTCAISKASGASKLHFSLQQSQFRFSEN